MHEMLLYSYGGGIMGDIVKLTIDGREVEAKKGDTILNSARRNGHYIPTMCYLSKLNPITSCRVCVVKVDGMDGNILSCQERVAEGISVTTSSDELFKHRQNILKMYDVNHPLQCGVCAKSGECDLQNKTMEMQVTSQNFSAREQNREIQDWGYITYDPYLCILCERCVRVSNEIVGDSALQIEVGGYNSTIVNTKKSDNNIDWGECAAVCPVGALSDKDFKFKTNAWEQKRVPASCIHTPLASLIYYEVKHDKIFRVRSEYEFDSISGICRYGYSFENRGSNSQDDMQRALEAFKDADTINFTSLITNEEALILQRLKEKFGYKLVNREAKNYQEFLQAYSSTSGRTIYSGTSQSIQKSDFIITLGSRISADIPVIKFKINEAVKKNKAPVYYMHPIEDYNLKGIVSTHIKYEVGSEEGVLALVLKAILKDIDISSDLEEFIGSLDDGYISAESNVGEEEIDRLYQELKRKNSPSLIVGSDLYAHPRALNIAKMLGVIDRYSNFKITIIPSLVNTIGVSQICELDSEGGSRVIGYNTVGDFVLSSLEDKGDVNMPALNQQEGTFTNLDKRVVPTNVALNFDGFCLNDIACELGIGQRYTIDYTEQLPQNRGYKSEKFDHLPNEFLVTGEELRGYELTICECDFSDTIEGVQDIASYDGIVVYSCNPNSQKNIFSNVCKDIVSDGSLVGSKQFSIAAKISDGDRVEFDIDGIQIVKEFRVDDKLKGSIALVPNFDLGFEGNSLFSRYRYNKIKLKRVD
jgi:NADH-quinone oxidoreductase subunit G